GEHRARRVVLWARGADQRVTDVLDDLDERIQEGDLLRAWGQDPDRIHDSGREEEDLRHELPDLADVAEADEQRRQDQPQPERVDVELQEQGQDEQPARPWRYLVPGDEDDRHED